MQENNCAGAGTTAWRLANPSENVAGFATQTSFNLGQNVPLKIARNAPVMPATKVDISVYRLGYYGNTGSRLIAAASQTGVTVNNDFTCNPKNAQTGLPGLRQLGCRPTRSRAPRCPRRGVYLAKIRATDTGIDNHILFVVRDDNRVPDAKVLFVAPDGVLPGLQQLGRQVALLGQERQRRDRGRHPARGQGVLQPADRCPDRRPRPLPRPRPPPGRLARAAGLRRRLHRQRRRASEPRRSCARMPIVVLGAHDEYMSGETMAGLKAARDAGTASSTSAPTPATGRCATRTAGATLVCYKTVQGSGSSGTGTVTPNDPGPDGVTGTADDALGADRTAGTADDRPDNATTTFRDNGAPPGDPNAPPGGRVGPDQPENSLFGVMYIGDNQQLTWAVRVPPANADGEFAGDRAWRNTGISTTAGGTRAPPTPSAGSGTASRARRST